MKYTNFHPEIQKLLNELEELKDRAQMRANIICSPDYPNESEHEMILRQTKNQAVADTYGYCQLRLRMLEI